jgi:hypothetical protein
MFGNLKPENRILELDNTEANDRLNLSGECTKADSTPQKLTAYPSPEHWSTDRG